MEQPMISPIIFGAFFGTIVMFCTNFVALALSANKIFGPFRFFFEAPSTNMATVFSRWMMIIQPRCRNSIIRNPLNIMNRKKARKNWSRGHQENQTQWRGLRVSNYSPWISVNSRIKFPCGSRPESQPNYALFRLLIFEFLQ